MLQLGYLVGPHHASVVLDRLQLGRDLAYQLEIFGVGSVSQMFVIDGNLVLEELIFFRFLKKCLILHCHLVLKSIYVFLSIVNLGS